MDKSILAIQELQNISEAKRFDRERFEDDTAFADWVQSRCRHVLAIPAVFQPMDGDWKNMALANWFPISAGELTRLQVENAMMRARAAETNMYDCTPCPKTEKNMDISCHWVTSVRVETKEIAGGGSCSDFFRTAIIVKTEDGEHTINLFPKERHEPLEIEIGEVERLAERVL